jgi:hypothetical protein
MHPNMKVIENQVYHKLCLFYKGESPLENLTDPEFSDVMNDAMAYGVGNRILSAYSSDAVAFSTQNDWRNGKFIS